MTEELFHTESGDSDFGLGLDFAKVVLSFTHVGGLILYPKI